MTLTKGKFFLKKKKLTFCKHDWITKLIIVYKVAANVRVAANIKVTANIRIAINIKVTTSIRIATLN